MARAARHVTPHGPASRFEAAYTQQGGARCGSEGARGCHQGPPRWSAFTSSLDRSRSVHRCIDHVPTMCTACGIRGHAMYVKNARQQARGTACMSRGRLRVSSVRERWSARARRACTRTPTRPPVAAGTDRRFGRGVDSTSTRPHFDCLDTFHSALLHIRLQGHATPHTHVPPNSRTIMQHEPRTWPGATQKSTRHVPLTLSLTGGLSI